MKKIFYQILLPLCILGMMFSCSDSNKTQDEPEPAPTAIEKELENITNKLATIEGIKDFTEVFKAAKIDVKTEELTILATSTAPQKRSLKASPESINKDNIKRHIIAGVHDFFAMKTDTLKLESIDGTKLYVTKHKNVIYINGIALTKDSNEKISKSVIYILESVIPVENKPVTKYSLNVKVQESLYGVENIAKPYKALDGVIVYFYQLENKARTSVDSVLTNSEGTAVLHHNIEGDIYYAAKKINYTYKYKDYLLQGVFTNATQVESTKYQASDLYKEAHVGGPKYADLNGDGIINNDDKIEDTGVTNKDKTLEIFMQKDDLELVPEQIDINEYSKALDESFANMLVNYYNLDVKLSTDSGSYANLLPNIESLNKEYFVSAYTFINRFNYVDLVPESLSLGNKIEWEKIKDKHIAQLIYTYVTLTDSYATPHVLTEIPDATAAIKEYPNTPTQDIFNYLEQKRSQIGGEYQYAAKLALARAYMNTHKYQEAYMYVKEVISSGKYTLVNGDRVTIGNMANNKEVILGSYASKGFKYNQTIAYIHPLRYTEAILIAAEASHKLGKSNEALNYLNQLLARDGQTRDISDLENLPDYWESEMFDEGQWFITNGRRWNKIHEIMPKAKEHNNLLPFPKSETGYNKGLIQNTGY